MIGEFKPRRPASFKPDTTVVVGPYLVWGISFLPRLRRDVPRLEINLTRARAFCHFPALGISEEWVWVDTVDALRGLEFNKVEMLISWDRLRLQEREIYLTAVAQMVRKP